MNELQKTTYNGVWNYNGQTITEHGTGFTVYHEGEELFFENLDQAKNFINNLEV